MLIVTAAQMREMDRLTIEKYGVPSLSLMERAGEGLAVSWKLEKRPLREKRIEPNRLDDDQKFTLRQVVTGADDGFALLADHDGQKVGLILAQPQPQRAEETGERGARGVLAGDGTLAAARRSRALVGRRCGERGHVSD